MYHTLFLEHKYFVFPFGRLIIASMREIRNKHFSFIFVCFESFCGDKVIKKIKYENICVNTDLEMKIFEEILSCLLMNKLIGLCAGL